MPAIKSRSQTSEKKRKADEGFDASLDTVGSRLLKQYREYQ